MSALTRPDAEKGERLYAWPSFLANSRTVLFTIVPIDASAAPKMAWLDLDSLETQVLPLNGSAARFVATGHLIYAAGPALMAVPFDLAARTTRGQPVAIRGVTMATAADNGAAELAVSGTGTLAFIEPGIVQQREMMSLAWVDQRGARSRCRCSREGSSIRVSPRTAHGSRWTSQSWATATFGSGTCAARAWLDSRMDRARTCSRSGPLIRGAILFVGSRRQHRRLLATGGRLDAGPSRARDPELGVPELLHSRCVRLCHRREFQ